MQWFCHYLNHCIPDLLKDEFTLLTKEVIIVENTEFRIPILLYGFRSYLRFSFDGKMFLINPLMFDKESGGICSKEINVPFIGPSFDDCVELAENNQVMGPFRKVFWERVGKEVLKTVEQMKVLAGEVFEPIYIAEAKAKHSRTDGFNIEVSRRVFSRESSITSRPSPHTDMGTFGFRLRKQVCVAKARRFFDGKSGLSTRSLEKPHSLGTENAHQRGLVSYMLTLDNPALKADEYALLASVFNMLQITKDIAERMKPGTLEAMSQQDMPPVIGFLQGFATGRHESAENQPMFTGVDINSFANRTKEKLNHVRTAIDKA